MKFVVVLWIITSVFSFPVAQQPLGKYHYVTPRESEVTQFRYSTNVTLLAHNYLAGSNFYELSQGDTIYLQEESGFSIYSVYAIDRYQKLSNYSYKNLASSETISVYELMEMYYSETDLTLQTCISRGNNKTWGLMFVVSHRLPIKDIPVPK